MLANATFRETEQPEFPQELIGELERQFPPDAALVFGGIVFAVREAWQRFTPAFERINGLNRRARARARVRSRLRAPTISIFRNIMSLGLYGWSP
jgi:hypothetical protein